MDVQYLFGFHLIPREAVLRIFGHIPESVDLSAVWSKEWSPYRLFDDWEAVLTKLLPVCTPSGLLSSLWMWGYYERDRVQVAVNAGTVKSINVRTDLRRLSDSAVTRAARLLSFDGAENLPVLPDDSFLSGIAEFARSSNCLILVDDSAKLVNPDDLMTAVRDSSAYKFVCTFDWHANEWCQPGDVLSPEEIFYSPDE